jgi:hypothetical protein
MLKIYGAGMTQRDADREQAAREGGARRWLLGAGAAALPRMPWLAGRQPPAAADLIQFALWRSQPGGRGAQPGGRGAQAGGRGAQAGGRGAQAGGTGADELLAALTLLPAARAEVDQAEAALLFTARAHGLSWTQISRAMGLGSPQAAQQRFGRVTGRAGHAERSRPESP